MNIEKLLIGLPNTMNDALNASITMIRSGRERELLQILSKSKNQPYTNLLKAQILTAGNMHKEALSLLTDLEGKFNKNPSITLELAKQYLKLGLIDEANIKASELISINERDPISWITKATCQQMAGENDEAMSTIELGLLRAGGHPKLTYAMAQLQRQQNLYKEAIKNFEKAIALGIKDINCYKNLADCHCNLNNPDKAVSEITKGLDVFKDNIELHKLLIKIQIEYSTSLKPYNKIENAISKSADPTPLITLLARHHARDKAWSKTAMLLRGRNSLVSANPELRFLEIQSAHEDKVNNLNKEALDNLIAERPKDLSLHQEYGRMLLESGYIKEAEEIFKSALRIYPNDFICTGYLESCWRLLKSQESKWLCDYEKMISIIDFKEQASTPRIKGIDEYISTIKKIHNTKCAPHDQTVKGGTQSNGHLFKNHPDDLNALELHLKNLIFQSISKFPSVEGHPFWSTASRIKQASDLEFSGAWSIILRNEGFHTNHIHPQGWMSAVLYLKVPSEISDTSTFGHIQFGKPLGIDLPPQRTIRPKPGRLITFPSYMWHGTIPFESTDERIAIAFDIIPK
ncbi:putative 2OG-Fe(II) oxygenase [Simiduia sp. 21SJ11W-1]|uniref:putative 2OG-Fe(II) oxygenase n=1 Tax=Simiduia sp. 21SJ11W-1 TaxID=2909669 RepID=UPI00209E2A1A|nr:putative 2OG-Fe(II) oxygenase [Simiduia sp. 21SJ11W-1]UTA48791.1 putative 2OG-Fe(II) oxygenase [Simiduia sp. 21SJ11W-1]